MAINPNESDVENLAELVKEIGTKGSTWKHDGNEYTLWLESIKFLIRRAYPGPEKDECLSDLNEAAKFPLPPRQTHMGQPDRYDEIKQTKYRKNLPQLAAFAEALLGDMSARLSSESENRFVGLVPPLRIFIAHDGPSPARDKLERFLRALGSEPVIVELSPGAGKSPGRKVDLHLNTCDFGIVLARKSQGVRQDNKILPRANIIDEMARFQHVLGDHRMLLLESGLSLPSNASDWTYETFSPQSMDRAFIAIVTELKDHRMLVVQGIQKA